MTRTAYKPEGYPSLAAYLMCHDPAGVVAFLETAFDAVEVRRYSRPDGGIRHVELRVDDSMVMLSEASDAYPALPTWLHLFVPDVDAVYARALAAGGTSAQAPQQKEDDPDRRGGVTDPAGNTWWISTQTG